MRKLIAEALDLMPEASPARVAEYLIANHGPTIDAWNFGKLTSAIKQSMQRRLRVQLKANPAQAWLPMPDLAQFQHIPVIVRKDSLEEYRERITAKEREIKSYKRSRLSIQNEKVAKRELREMRRLEKLIAPFFANDPTMDVEKAIDLYRASMISPKPGVRQRREAAKASHPRPKSRT
jgi:hypothetical protein